MTCHVGIWECYLVTVFVATLYVKPIVNYYWCKVLILSILWLVIKDWGCGKETEIFIYLFLFVNFANCLARLS